MGGLAGPWGAGYSPAMPPYLHGSCALALGACALFSPVACSSANGPPSVTASGTDGGPPSTSPHDEGGTGADGNASGPSPGGDADAAKPGTDGGSLTTDGGYPSGWLYTKGAKIYVSNGSSAGTPWMGRGVNIDDIFFCGYDNSLWMTSPDQTLKTVLSGLMSGWKPTFIRMSLAMDSYGTAVSWLTNPAQYRTPMTGVIEAIGAYPGVHVLVTLRSDPSMIGQDQADGDPEATGLPSDKTSTPSATTYPSGTDATYVALVDTFGASSFVLFGLTNEPGGNKLSNATIAAAMSHAVGVIRAEEDRLEVPHHIVSVQGNGWSSDVSFYATAPLPYDNVVYEVHGYPPAASSYTFSNIPIIVGEYGSLTDPASFYADLETKQIPNLAWDFDSYSNCSPDLLNVNQSATNLVPTSWGTTVQSYLLAH
jgi:hypothetical protein